MGFCIQNAEASEDIVQIVVDSLVRGTRVAGADAGAPAASAALPDASAIALPDEAEAEAEAEAGQRTRGAPAVAPAVAPAAAPALPLSVLVAHLYAISDILHNSTAKAKNAASYRRLFEPTLVEVSVLFMYRYILRESCSQFDSLPLTSLTVHRVEVAAALGSVYNRLASRLTAATLKEKVLAVLHTWEHWSLFPPFFLIGLEATFLDEDALDAGGPPSAARDALAAQLATIEESDIDGKDLRRKCKLAGVRDSGGGKQLMLRLHGVNAFVRARHGGAGEAYDPARAVAAAGEGGSVGVGAYGAAAPQAAAVATGAEEEEGDDDDIDGVPLDDDDVMDGAPF
jgi:hypothetical protein